MTRVSVEQLPFTTKFFTYLPYFIVLLVSYCREFFGKITGLGAGGNPLNPTKPGYPPLIKGSLLFLKIILFEILFINFFKFHKLFQFKWRMINNIEITQ